jgi:hypothetical protein
MAGVIPGNAKPARFLRTRFRSLAIEGHPTPEPRRPGDFGKGAESADVPGVSAIVSSTLFARTARVRRDDIAAVVSLRSNAPAPAPLTIPLEGRGYKRVNACSNE